jgi:hypothetical protein
VELFRRTDSDGRVVSPFVERKVDAKLLNDERRSEEAMMRDTGTARLLNISMRIPPISHVLLAVHGPLKRGAARN